MIRFPLLAVVALAALLAGCDLAEITGEAKLLAAREAEGKAIGSACRHAGRAIEDCYAKSPKVSKAAIFNGWRDMDAYMRENNIQVVLPDALKEEAQSEQKLSAGEGAEKADEAVKAAEVAPAKAASGDDKKAAAPADAKNKTAAADDKKKPAAVPIPKAPAGTTAQGTPPKRAA